jgi:membrane-bound serine protease (ClpP class)
VARSKREAVMFLRGVALVLALLGSTLLSWVGHAQPEPDKAPPMRAAPPPVLVVDIKGAIGVGTGHLLEEVLARARNERAGLVVLRLDTPGGLVSATRDVIGAILASPVPVVVFVGPSGARAASAGTYIAYASHVAAMAPGTHLGAATPVQMGAPPAPAPQPHREGDKPGTDQAGAMERKVLNDAVAYLRSLAQLRGRNGDWAEKAVRDGATLTAEEAAREKVVDLLAGNVGDLLDRLDGRTVRTTDGERVLATRHARVIEIEPGWKSRVLAVVTDPNIAFILLMIGVYGIIFEFWHPGLAGPGIVGAICLLVGLMALSVLPLNLAGLGLLALGIGMMAAEAFTPGIGVLGLGGVVAFILGGLFLFDPAGADVDFAVAWPVVIGAAITNALLFVGLLGMILRVRRRKVVTGAEQMIGLEGRVIDWENGHGRIRVHGEVWSARAPAPLAPGAPVRVDRRDGLTLHVEPREGT